MGIWGPILTSAAAALAGATQGGPSSSQKGTSEQNPWAPQQPYLEYMFDQARKQYEQSAPQYYPNRTYVPFSSQTENALGMAEQRAYGSPVESSFQNYVTNQLGGPNANSYYNSFMQGTPVTSGQRQVNSTAGGDFLNSNPYLDQMYNTAAQRVTETFNDQVMPGINASFGAAGGRGSKIHQELATDAAGELSQTLGQMSANIYGNNYQQERARQMQAAQLQGNQGLSAGALMDANQRGAAGMAPTAANIDWNNIDRMRQVGGAVEQQAGNVLQDDMARWNHYQYLPQQMLQNYQGVVGGQNYGSQGSNYQRGSSSGNSLSGGIGGAMSGFRLGQALFPG